MTDPIFYLTMATAGLVALAMVVGAGLAGWRGWLALKGREIERSADCRGSAPGAGARIELADLKERIRRLEAIAAGVDL